MNLRPSGYEPDELPGCSTPRWVLDVKSTRWGAFYDDSVKRSISVFCGPGGDLLFRALRQSTIGAGSFHDRVRNGIGCRPPAIATRPAKSRSSCLLASGAGRGPPSAWLSSHSLGRPLALPEAMLPDPYPYKSGKGRFQRLCLWQARLRVGPTGPPPRSKPGGLLRECNQTTYEYILLLASVAGGTIRSLRLSDHSVRRPLALPRLAPRNEI